MAGKPLPPPMAALLMAEDDGSSAIWPERKLYGRGERSATTTGWAPNSRSRFAPNDRDEFQVRFNVAEHSFDHVLNECERFPVFNGGNLSERAPVTRKTAHSLRLLNVRIGNRHTRSGRLGSAHLARSRRLHECSGVKVLPVLACGVPRANRPNLDTVRIERPRNVLDVSRERRAKERTNELPTALATGLAEKALGKIVRSDGLACVRHRRSVHERTNERNARFAMYPVFVRILDGTFAYHTHERMSSTYAYEYQRERKCRYRHVDIGEHPPHIPRRGLYIKRDIDRLDCVGFSLLGASAS
jgi:hypothetical protein